MKHLVVLSIVAIALAACASPRDTRMAEGAAIGGTAGAIVGGVTSGTTGGAAVGAAAGAVAGAAIADATRPHHGRYTCHWSSVLHKKVCRYR